MDIYLPYHPSTCAGRWDIVTCLRIDMFAVDLEMYIYIYKYIKFVGAI